MNNSACIIKAVWEHASVGLDEDSIITPADRNHLCREIAQRQKAWNREFFAERYIDGREFNLSLLAGERGPEVLPPAEIKFVDYPAGKQRVVGYRAKWDEASFEYQHTQRCFSFPEEDRPLLDQGMTNTTSSHAALACSGCAGGTGSLEQQRLYH